MVMDSVKKAFITVSVSINAPVQRVWECWTTPADIVRWNYASADWQTTRAINDLRTEGKFSYWMEAKDGSFGFDFGGTYVVVDIHKNIEFLLADNRRVTVNFQEKGLETAVIETFEAEEVNPVDMQRAGWQAILNNFKQFVESI
jgi:uncharacterized protein YndB with AHSA1/START domain